MFSSLADKLVLSNGVQMPGIGFGTWQVPTDSTLENAVSAALKLGYRFFDTAQIYGNASAIGRGVLLSDLPRAEIFISSKIWTSHRSYDGVMRAFTDIIEQLKTTYLDQLLIHWPATQGEPMIWQSQNAGTWRALFVEVFEGAVKVIGVSNLPFRPGARSAAAVSHTTRSSSNLVRSTASPPPSSPCAGACSTASYLS